MTTTDWENRVTYLREKALEPSRGEATDRRYATIREGIRRSRHDKAALYDVRETLENIASRGRVRDPFGTWWDRLKTWVSYYSALGAGYLFPYLVGIMAPSILTLKGKAWAREMRKAMTEAPTARDSWHDRP